MFAGGLFVRKASGPKKLWEERVYVCEGGHSPVPTDRNSTNVSEGHLFFG